jgi:hypothetical protein
VPPTSNVKCAFCPAAGREVLGVIGQGASAGNPRGGVAFTGPTAGIACTLPGNTTMSDVSTVYDSDCSETHEPAVQAALQLLDAIVAGLLTDLLPMMTAPTGTPPRVSLESLRARVTALAGEGPAPHTAAALHQYVAAAAKTLNA